MKQCELGTFGLKQIAHIPSEHHLYADVPKLPIHCAGIENFE